MNIYLKLFKIPIFFKLETINLYKININNRVTHIIKNIIENIIENIKKSEIDKFFFINNNHKYINYFLFVIFIYYNLHVLMFNQILLFNLMI